ncbi:tumor necrosis factor receptor superfamily member 5 isoform X2 [Mixophyes fleayi]|uniref:tumor necrosis factor receptor superfamily member 5 isoform X2 n=1 Tax=Mixophyes fleayi TaxID=3061075 RepID=UPI003F4DC304
MSLWILLLTLCSWYYQGYALSCDTTQYEEGGRCCSLCKAGQRLNKVCTENSDTECLNCADGEYQETWNRETSCHLHQYCDESFGFYKISEGTSVSNVNCSCQEGKHCSGDLCETCVLNAACGPGEGVTQRASRNLDTQCSPCATGTFSEKTSDTEPCTKWSICSETQQEIHLGNSTTDVVCGTRPADNTVVYAVIIPIVLVLVCIFGVLMYVKQRRSRQKATIQKKEHPPKIDEQPLCLILKQDNHPVEDQDITMQGLPVAQEQGKDYHLPQEEVREHLLDV